MQVSGGTTRTLSQLMRSFEGELEDHYVLFYPFYLAGLPADYYKSDGTLICDTEDLRKHMLASKVDDMELEYKTHRFGLVVFVQKRTHLVTDLFLTHPAELSIDKAAVNSCDIIEVASRQLLLPQEDFYDMIVGKSLRDLIDLSNNLHKPGESVCHFTGNPIKKMMELSKPLAPHDMGG